MDTMMVKFVKQIEHATGKPFNGKRCHVSVSNIFILYGPALTLSIRCLAHIVNLATQAFLGAHSKLKAYDPKSPNNKLIAKWGAQQDEVRVVWTIMVKEQSSAKQKQLFLTIQTQDKPDHPPCEHPFQLLLDMPICWFSTFLMLDPAETLKVDVDMFVQKLVAAEWDHDQWMKMMNLLLTDEEWACIHVLLALLGKAKEAQHSFSSDRGPAIHLAIPGLEALHKAWYLHANKAKYMDFWMGLEASVTKITKYYERSVDSDVYIMAMCMWLLISI